MSNKDIMVTVAVVTYNQEKYISRTLDCIAAQQTDYRFEVIIGDDGSTDGTRAICEEYVRKYDYMKLMPNEPNMGVTANWIRCINAGNGKYLMTCAGDDYWHNKNKIQLQVDFMESHSDCVICHTDIDVLHDNTGIINRNDKQARHITPPQGMIQQYVLQGKEQISAVTMCIRRSAFEKHVPTDKFIELRFPREDWPTELILSAYGEVCYLPISTATYRIGQESITRTFDYERIIKRAEQDKGMLEYLYTLFPEWGPFNQAAYFDNMANHQIVNAAYHNNDYKTAHKYAQKDIFKTAATKCAKTWITFKLMRMYGIRKNKF